MLPHQWETFKKASRMEKLDKVPMALIIDSPWIPGYLGIKHLDYFLDPELWFQSNLKIAKEFPDIIFVPSWWMDGTCTTRQKCALLASHTCRSDGAKRESADHRCGRLSRIAPE